MHRYNTLCAAKYIACFDTRKLYEKNIGKETAVIYSLLHWWIDITAVFLVESNSGAPIRHIYLAVYNVICINIIHYTLKD